MKVKTKKRERTHRIALNVGLMVLMGLFLVIAPYSIAKSMDGKEKDGVVVELPDEYKNLKQKEIADKIFIKLISNEPNILSGTSVFQIKNIFSFKRGK